jgi:galactonate dehydratase
MKISSFDVIQVNAGWRIWTFIRIEAASCIGWAEVSDSNTCNPSTKAFLNSLREFIVGTNADHYVTTLLQLRQKFVQNLGFSALKPLAGVENALIDLFCKLNSISAIAFLHGHTTGSVEVYWSHFGTTRVRAYDVCRLTRLDSPEHIKDALHTCSELGISTVKSNIIVFPNDEASYVFMPGAGKGYNQNQIYPSRIDFNKSTSAIHKWLDFLSSMSSLNVAIDLNYNYPPHLVSTLPIHVAWYEFDCYSSLHIDQYLRQFPRHVSLASGENCLTSESLSPLLKSDLPIVSIDPCWLGMSKAMSHATLCEHYGKSITVHNFNGHLATYISLAFCSTLSNICLLEVDIDDVPWKDKIFTNKPVIINGCLSYDASLAGWGCDLDIDQAYEYIIN